MKAGRRPEPSKAVIAIWAMGRESWIRMWHHMCLEPVRCVRGNPSFRTRFETIRPESEGQEVVQVRMHGEPSQVVDLGPSFLAHLLPMSMSAALQSTEPPSSLQRLVDSMEENTRKVARKRRLILLGKGLGR